MATTEPLHAPALPMQARHETKQLRPIEDAPEDIFASIRCVLTDVDDTLTHESRVSAATFAALEELATAGIPVVPVTAAPAAWCEAMVHLWPIAGAIAENGGIAIKRHGRSILREYWHGDHHEEKLHGLVDAGDEIRAAWPTASLSDDQPFRRTSLAFNLPTDVDLARQIQQIMMTKGLSTTVNSPWVLGWQGAYDKLLAAQRFLPWLTGHDIETDRHGIFYVGDSRNDEVMFAEFPHCAGVSTIVAHAAGMRALPAWVTRGPGGAGFVEVAERILSSRRSSE